MKKNQFFIIPEYLDTFYIIPEDRGGKAISNIDKKSLHLSYKNSNNQNRKICNFNFRCIYYYILVNNRVFRI